MAEISVRWLCRGLATVGATLLAKTVSAQAGDTVAPMPVWDASGSVAVHFIRVSELHDADDGYYDCREEQCNRASKVVV